MADKLPYLHIVADYGPSDLAFSEIIQRFKYLLPQTEIYPTSVPSFSTLTNGFIIAQLALYNPGKNLFIFANTAPRKDDHKKREANEGEKFKYALLKNGVQICAVDAGWCFSFVKKDIVDFRLINVQNKGSQFRSRDFYPDATVGIINGKHTKYLGEKLLVNSIPAVPDNRIAYIDSFGNIKTTIRRSQVKLSGGSKIRIVVNHIYQTGIYANGNFEVKSGDMAFAPGSSGGSDAFMEIFLRSGNASHAFDHPPVETKIRIEKI